MKLVFKNVSKIHNRKQQTYDLREVNTSFLDSRNIAVLPVHERSGTSFLKVTAGIERPTRGSVERNGIFTGPIGDSAFFHGELTGEENIRFICKLYGQNTSQTLEAIKNFSGLNKELKQKTKSYKPGIRQKIAISTALLIKSDVYQLTTTPKHPHKPFNRRVQNKLMELSTQAKLILATNDTETLEKYAECSIVIDDQGYLSSFDDLSSGLNAREVLKEAQ